MAESSAPKRVVGVKYEPSEGLPQIILKGAGPIAEEILKRRMQTKNAPQVVKNESLLKQLYRLPIDSSIGPELFHVVATILVHVLAVEEKLKSVKD